MFLSNAFKNGKLQWGFVFRSFLHGLICHMEMKIKKKLKKYSYFTNYSYACEPVDKNENFPFLQERYTLAEIEFHFRCCPYEQL